MRSIFNIYSSNDIFLKITMLSKWYTKNLQVKYLRILRCEYKTSALLILILVILMKKSDLFIEAVSVRADGVVTSVKTKNNIKVTSVSVKNNKVYDKGKYITIEYRDVFDNDIKGVLVSCLKSIFRTNKLTNSSNVLFVGLGNSKCTSDSLGPLVIDNIIVTRHLSILGIKTNKQISAIKPGVTGETGIETKDIIACVVDKIKPDFVVVVDSLKSNSISRLNKTIQITDTGIHPGSGVNNKRVALNKKTLGIPVIAIGVPTVCDIGNIIKNVDDMIVTSKDIDFIIDKLSDLISISLNEVIYNFKI